MIRLSLSCCAILFFQALLFAKDYNILDFGAKGDGNTLNTTQIQAAIDAAHKKGGGRVVIPAGRFLSGTIVLRSDVELHLLENAVLLGSADFAHYTVLSKWKSTVLADERMIGWKALVLSDSQQNIAITGKGEIDGQGRKLALHIDSLYYAGQLDSMSYDFVDKRPQFYVRPQIIEFLGCKDVRLQHVTLKNSASWVQTYNRCENVVIDSIRVDSDAYWNNDGIDIVDCKNVRITNCFVNAADDGICVKSHYKGQYCDNIYVANCTVRSSASAIKLGAKSNGGFKNVTIENIKVYDTFRSAVAIESVDGGFLENVLVNNVHAVNTGNAIFIRLGTRYPNSTLKNVTLKNIKVEVAFKRPDYAYEIRGPELPFFHNTFPASITGVPGNAVENVTLENIEIIYPGRGNSGLAHMPVSRLDKVPEKEKDYPEFSMFGELPAWGFYVRHVDGLTMKNIKLSIEAPDYRPALVFDDVQRLSIESLSITGDSKPKQIILYRTEDTAINQKEAILKL